MRSFLIATVFLIAAHSAEAKPKKAVTSPKKAAPTAPTPAPEAAPAPADGAPSTVRGPTRIDFDDRLIQGQSNKSGAVYLYDRKELKIRSMIKKRDNFRDEIVGSLYDT
jgi:hypothetical protein